MASTGEMMYFSMLVLTAELKPEFQALEAKSLAKPQSPTSPDCFAALRLPAITDLPMAFIPARPE